jgi:hypothetical protein
MSRSTAVRQIVAVALEPFDASVLHDPLVAQARAIEVAVVAPALNTRLRHWVSEEFSLPVVHMAVEAEDAERAARAPVAFCTFGARPLPR